MVYVCQAKILESFLPNEYTAQSAILIDDKSLGGGGFSATAGTVKLKPVTLLINSSTEQITNWQPGDVATIEWTVENAGNKSVYTKNTIEIAWDIDTELAEQNIIYLYPPTMSDDEIRADIANGAPNSIPLGSDTNEIDTGKRTVQGFVHSFSGDILDGVRIRCRNR